MPTFTKPGRTDGRPGLLLLAVRAAIPIAMALVVVVWIGATWSGQWGSGGRWTNPPLRWCFVDPGPGTPHPAATWSAAQKEVARSAIAEWYTPAAKDSFSIEESTPANCDVTIRWEDDDFFKNWNPPDLSDAAGYWHGPAGQTEPGVPTSADFPANEIYLNLTPRAECATGDLTPVPWYVDATPTDDNEFPDATVYPDCTYHSASGTPAAGRLDLYTVVKHEFGHALGLVHPQTPTPGVMDWCVYLGQRKHLCPDDENKFLDLYATQTPTPTPTTGFDPGKVGGMAELAPGADISAQSGTPADGSGRSAGAYAALAGSLAAVVIALGSCAEYARRRWLR